MAPTPPVLPGDAASDMVLCARHVLMGAVMISRVFLL